MSKKTIFVAAFNLIMTAMLRQVFGMALHNDILKNIAMYLKSLEISGFKSFAKKSELLFNVPISAIVGPNGSGKSNVAEALRFVLGEQSIKSMRGKKGEDLIFNGSNEAPRANRASVKITFDNSRRFLDIDFDEVSIERVVHRDGVNEYFINGTQVRLKDVLEILAAAHIGSSGHHIISQGEADRILNSNIKERKSMIEDALGLKIYQYKRQESERKLQKTDENIKSVESLRREIQPHIKFLKKQVEKVEKAMEMKIRLGSLYKEYLKREQIYIKSEENKIALDKKPLIEKMKALEDELKVAKAVLSASKTFDIKSKEIIALEERLASARGEKDGLARELGRTEGELASEERILKKQKEIAQSGALQTVPLGEVEILSESIEKEISSAEKAVNLSNLKNILGTIRELFSKFILKHKNSANKSALAESEQAIAKLIEHKKELETKIAGAVKNEREIGAEYGSLQKEIEREKDTNRDAEKKVFEIHALQNEISSKRSVINAREETIRIESENFKRELGEAGAILGREVLDYEAYDLKNETGGAGAAVSAGTAGGAVSDSDVLKEERSAQESRRREIEKIKIRLEDSGVGASEEIMKEYREVSERDAFLTRELEDLEKSAEALQRLITELLLKIDIEFKEGIQKINKQFQEFFSLMFGGGEASLKVIKEVKRKRSDTDISGLLSEDGEGAPEISEPSEEEESEEGIDIHVSLPRKKVKGLMMLSGGERALTSIALIFAMSQVKPPPFVVLDETDAALDEANSRKYGDMVENLSKLSQLILITHNRETMSRAGNLYGVTMTGGVSKLLSIQFDEAVVVAK